MEGKALFSMVNTSVQPGESQLPGFAGRQGACWWEVAHRSGYLVNRVRQCLTMQAVQHCLSCFMSLLGCCSCTGCLHINRNKTLQSLSKDSVGVAAPHTRATHHFMDLGSSRSCSILFAARAKMLITKQLYLRTSREEFSLVSPLSPDL